MTHELDEKFIGTGEIKGMVFKMLTQNDHSFLWQVINGDSVHYEVWLKKTNPVCIDFENRIYSETEFKYRKPKAKDFGIWAWSFTNNQKALKKFLI